MAEEKYGLFAESVSKLTNIDADVKSQWSDTVGQTYFGMHHNMIMMISTFSDYYSSCEEIHLPLGERYNQMYFYDMNSRFKELNDRLGEL